MSKRAFSIHGWESSPNKGWHPWLKNELEERGFKVTVPSMPDTYHPQKSVWVNYLTKVVGIPDKDCYFVGHSLGCIAILRYLESLEEGQQVGGVILVAGFDTSLGPDYKELESFLAKPVDWEKVKSHCKNFVAIHSDNDPYVPLRYGDTFKEKLNAKLIIQHNMKHFSGDDGIIELPIVLNSLLRISA